MLKAPLTLQVQILPCDHMPTVLQYTKAKEQILHD